MNCVYVSDWSRTVKAHVSHNASKAGGRAWYQGNFLYCLPRATDG